MICPKTEFEEDLYRYLKEGVINLSRKEISNIYSYWKSIFDEQQCDITETKIISDKSLIQQNVPEDVWLLGIDFPSWFNTPQNQKLKIMILGIDPLRNEATFRDLKADTKNNVIIGTPYGLHLPKMRTGRTKHYWNFINMLSEQYFVYLTDIYKVFFYTNQSKTERSYVYYRKNSNQEQKSLLQKEINLINPDLIITLGGECFFQLTNKKVPMLARNIELNIADFDGKFPVIPMVHLSGSTRQNNILTFLKENQVSFVEKNFGLGYYNIIHTFLEKLNK